VPRLWRAVMWGRHCLLGWLLGGVTAAAARDRALQRPLGDTPRRRSRTHIPFGSI